MKKQLCTLLLTVLALPGAAAEPELEVTWLGTTTVHVTDGQTALITDGFFSRPSLSQVITGLIEPDEQRIDTALAGADMEQLEAILVLHSHHDHAMDVAAVARRTGAFVVGSQSTANVARGGGLAEARILQARAQRILRFGDFEVEFLPSAHAPMPRPVSVLSGHGRRIERPLVPPAPVSAWKEGESYAVHLRHPAGSLLIQGSAGFRGGELDGREVDLALLSTAGLGRHSREHQQGYFREMVETGNAHTVIPVHWDNFFMPLQADMPALGWPLENHGRSMRALRTPTEESGRTFLRIRTMDTVRVRRGKVVDVKGPNS